ncbi:zinc dependent phospholipase C family protein [Spirochaetia bacterium 38H-sp]|uniref:Zinc dependent phospholipase C family protein n=1 Tax=Rarispira pelagica TaxID=3141764 RepID=A0ABU9U941_9SPIR
MPKEYTHFSIAYTAYNSLKDSYLKKAIEKHMGLFFYGSVAPDTIFYALRAEGSDKNRISSLLHGKSGVDSLLPVKRLFSISDFESDRELRDSFIAGYVTHVMADIHFHPMVFFFSGDNETPVEEVRTGSNMRHYAIESSMDLYMKDEVTVPLSASLENMLMKYSDNVFFLKMLSFIWYNDDKHMTDCKKGLRSHIWFQKRFSSSFWCGLNDFLSFFIPSLKSFRAIFYRKCFEENKNIWNNEYEYQHPVTGKKAKITVAKLINDTVDKILGLWKTMESASEKNMVPDWPEGNNLETGLSVDRNEPMVYFDISREPIKRLWSTCL